MTLVLWRRAACEMMTDDRHVGSIQRPLGCGGGRGPGRTNTRAMAHSLELGLSECTRRRRIFLETLGLGVLGGGMMQHWGQAMAISIVGP